MKNIIPGRKIFLKSTLFFSILITLVSCNNDQKSDSKDVAEEHNDAKFNNNDTERDAQFLVNASEINLEEMKLAELAQQNGYTTDVF